jgi:hypothetical protein
VFWAPVIVLGRILAEVGSPPPDVDDDKLLLIKRHDVVIGCTAGDAGTIGDAAIDADPGDGGIDDGGIDDAGVPDAGTTDAGACETIPGDAITMIVQPHVTIGADGSRFAVLLVTPQRPVLELQSHVFEPLAAITAPITHINRIEVPDQSLGRVCESWGGGGGCGGGDWGGGGGGDHPPPLGDASLGDGAIIEETLGPYQFVRAQPTSSQELAGWLDQLGYEYMPADLDAVAPYIALGYHVVAIRVSTDTTMTTNLVPVALTWPGSELRVPAALGRGNPYPSVFTVYIAAERKYVLPGAKIRFAKPTNSSGTTYLTRNELLLDQNQPVSSDPIAVHLDDYYVQESNVVDEYVHVPVEVPCDDEDEGGGCCTNCNAHAHTRFDWGVLALAVVFMLRRRRR